MVGTSSSRQVVLRRLLAAMLLACAVALTCAQAALASTWKPGDNLYDDRYLLSETEYQLAPGITEYDTTTNNSSGTAQNLDYFVEVDASTASAMVMAGTPNYDGTSWSLQRVTDQAAAAQAQFDEEGNGYKVVAVLNADFYNMSTGEPRGALVMNGTVYHEVNGCNYFAILNDGSAAIRTYADTDLSDVAQAVGGDAIILKDGVVQIGADTTDDYYAKSTTRTAVGIKADGSVVTMVCHGNVYPTSSGYNYYSVAQMLKARGCVDAIMLDGSGSSSFASMREGESEFTLRNSPSDGGERMVSTSILLVTKATSDGSFDHATLSPNNEVYTPNSTVQFSAKGVDSAGNGVDLPQGTSWKLADESYGTIDANGLFTSNGKTGEVKVQLYYNNSVVGTTTITVAAPTSITFSSEELTMGFSEESDLGLTVRYNGRSMNYNVGDIVWTLSDANLGTFNGNTFTSNDEDTITGTITATSAYDSTVSGSVKVEVGKLPSIVMDFEDYTNESGNVTSALDYWTIGRVCSKADPKSISDVVWVYDDEDGSANSDSTAIQEFYAAHRLLMLHYGTIDAVTGTRSDRGAKSYANLISKDDSEYADIVRFGNNALEMKYDFSSISGIEGACVGFTEEVTVSGHPTGIGVWVYCPEDTPNLWLRLRVATKNASTGELTYQYMNFTERMDTAYNNAANTTTAQKMGGLAQYSGQGWVYLECDVSSLTDEFVIPAGEMIRVMHTNGAYGITSGLGMGDYLADGTVISRSDCVGSIYIDNVQFVYGTNNADTVAPTISTFTANGEAVEDGLVLDDGTVDFTAYFADDDGRYASGIDYDNGGVHIYIDGVNYTDSATIFKDGTLRLDDVSLKNGSHNVRLVVNDADGNKATKEANITVAEAGNGESLELVAQGDATLGQPLSFNVVAPADANAQTVTMTVSIDKRYSSLYNVVAGIGYELVSQEYSTVNHTITMEFKRASGTPAHDATTGKVVVGQLTFEIPDDLASGSYFSYSVTASQYADASGNTGSYATGAIRMPVTAPYEIASDVFVTGLSGNFYVTDESGAAVAGASVLDRDTGELLGTTDDSGVLTIAAIDKESYHVYASKDGKLSFDITVDARSSYGDESGVPQTITVNGAGTTSKEISWFANPSVTKAAAVLQYSTSSDLSNATTVTGESVLTDFYGDDNASRINAVSLSGLVEGTTYYYRVGDGDIWSEVQQLSTGYSGANASMFLLADLQDDDTTNVEGILKTLSGGSYDLGVQLGDLVEEPYMESQWTEALGLFDGVGADILHVIGNHELFGDSDGSISSAIYGRDLGCYSVEYGNVYVATIPYSDGTTYYEEAVEWLKADAAQSNATWKLLMIHQPAYYTNTTGGNEAIHEILPSAAEEAGIDFVFSGHDHAYARTAALKGGEVSDDGVVYYICGSTGAKSYIMTDNEDFHFEKLSQDYDAVYLTLSTTDDSITVTTWNYSDGTSTVMDEYTKTKTLCAQHSYVRSGDRLVCETCGYSRSLESYTGWATDKDSGKQMYFLNGDYQTGWFTYGTDVYHFGSDGLAHDVQVDDVPTTCTVRGTITYTCECGAVKSVRNDPAPGHEYVEQEDGSYVCSVCGYKRIELSECTITLPYTAVSYTGEERRLYPTVIAPDGTQLEGGSVDFYVNWRNNVNVGIATAVVTAKSGYNVNLTEYRGDYGGQVEVTFEIRPPKVTGLVAQTVDCNTVALSWDGSDQIEVYQIEKSSDGGKTWTKAVETNATSYNVGSLTPSTDWQFRVRGYTTVDEATLYAFDYSDTASATTTEAPAGTSWSIVLDQEEFTYNGAARKPGVTVVDNWFSVMDPSSYTVAYENNKNAGIATVRVSLTTDSGVVELTKDFTINTASIAGCTADLSQIEYTYDGAAKEPTVTVRTAKGTKLVKGKNYEVAYLDNVNAGTATVRITGINNYSGVLTAEFAIAQASQSAPAAGEGYEIASGTTTATVLEGYEASLNGGKAWYTADDGTMNLKTAETITVRKAETENYLASEATTNDVPTNLGATNDDGKFIASVKFNENWRFRYTGGAITPEFTVYYNGEALTRDVDYTWDGKYYSDLACTQEVQPTERAWYYVKVTGIGDYMGFRKGSFQIYRASIYAVTWDKIPSHAYDGDAYTPVPVLTNVSGLEQLVYGEDFSVAYYTGVECRSDQWVKNPRKAGTYYAKCNGLGNYIGTRKVMFKITE